MKTTLQNLCDGSNTQCSYARVSDVFVKRSCKNVQLDFASSPFVSCSETCSNSSYRERIFMIIKIMGVTEIYRNFVTIFQIAEKKDISLKALYVSRSLTTI